MNGIIDFHSHILPGMDDGSSSLQESIAMLKMEAAQGIEHVVATPHFYAQQDSPEEFLKRRDAAEARLREEMKRHAGLPKLSMAAEVYFFPGMQHSDMLSLLTIRQTQYILIEMPNAPWSESMYRTLEEIRTCRELIPVVAHIDRYIRPFRTHRIPRRLGALPVLVQANAGFFLDFRTRRMAVKMLRDDQIHLLGSDCHNTTSRCPNLEDAVNRIDRHCGRTALGQIAFYQNLVLPD